MAGIPVNQGILHDILEEHTRKIIHATVQNAKPQITQQDLADGYRQQNVAFEIGLLNANSTLATEIRLKQKTTPL